MNALTRPHGVRSPEPPDAEGRRAEATHRPDTAVRRRSATVTLVAAIVTLVFGVLALTLGDYPLTVPEALGVFTGETEGFARTVVLEWRLPRAAVAVLFGAALAVAGGVFQTLTRNPLASPDIIGLANGSFTGMLVALLLLGGSWPLLTAGSLVGGLAAAVAIYLLAYRDGLQGFRFIVVGIGISAMLASVNTWMLLRVELETALFASAWGAGTLNGVTATTAVPAGICVVALLMLVPLLVPSLRQMDLGDDVARATGVRVDRARLASITVAVGLVSVATAVAGPIAFVALAAPQISRRLARSPGVPLGVTAAVGGALLLGSDLIAQHVIPLTVPVGVVTVALGGGYLVWLLLHEGRRR
ncbi:iron chelate uptake ABC transporter family permease subunit [Nocardiopsis sp. EMB25]|uniref:FecCD family ABC transporter permease n=1 Tax=Nocardiopsis TaxID=2013 RepID=UPI00034AAE17|nr:MULTISPECIES: iron chelate uptake ABC transporter family permease subunit [Nocardiopsis]MCY9786694.1 iron chelate uptake ABC transporter family permease subunit [Nocardiopsis sp. EMB25]